MDNLARDAMRMKALGYGVHYGRYKADYPHTADARRDPAPVATSATKVCENCGNTFSLDGRPRNAKYCSDFCYRQANNRRARDRARAKAGITDDDLRVCSVCGKEFRLEGRHAGCKYCSDECAAEVRRARNRERWREYEKRRSL